MPARSETSRFCCFVLDEKVTMWVHQQTVKVKNADSKKRQKTKRWMGQNVEWKKNQMGQNIEWKNVDRDKRSNSKKNHLEKTPNGNPWESWCRSYPLTMVDKMSMDRDMDVAVDMGRSCCLKVLHQQWWTKDVHVHVSVHVRVHEHGHGRGHGQISPVKYSRIY